MAAVQPQSLAIGQAEDKGRNMQDNSISAILVVVPFETAYFSWRLIVATVVEQSDDCMCGIGLVASIEVEEKRSGLW